MSSTSLCGGSIIRLDDEHRSDELEDILALLFQSGRTNAILAWLLVGVLVIVLVESILDFDRHWMVFVGVAGVLVLIPPAAYREWRVMLP